MRVRSALLSLGLLLIVFAGVNDASAQKAAARIRGAPGTMRIDPRPCPTIVSHDIRRRIVDLAVQEWAFFGFRVAAAPEGGDDDGRDEPRDERRRRSRLPPAEAERVAPSIAGYWAVTPQGPWIVERQNERWSGPDGIAARWNAPWSAAFISWVMCEAGLGAPARFQRAIAHHTYIDQALRARDGRAADAAFVAHDAGQTTIAAGDLLCSSRRPTYRTLAERRRQIGIGARSHCDIVVRVDEARGIVFAIGGNVRGVVSLKQFPAVRTAGRPLRAETGDDERPIFAHLKLRGEAGTYNGPEILVGGAPCVELSSSLSSPPCQWRPSW
jgi:hypothetical protein